jgi:hypothetical protein
MVHKLNSGKKAAVIIFIWNDDDILETCLNYYIRNLKFKVYAVNLFSTDGSQPILDRYVKDGSVRQIEINRTDGPAKINKRIKTLMDREKDIGGYFHASPHEFLYADGNIDGMINGKNDTSISYVNIVPPIRAKDLPLLRFATAISNVPLSKFDIQSKPNPFYFYNYGTKRFFIKRKNKNCISAAGIYIFNFPVRNERNYRSKISSFKKYSQRMKTLIRSFYALTIPNKKWDYAFSNFLFSGRKREFYLRAGVLKKVKMPIKIRLTSFRLNALRFVAQLHLFFQ